MNMIYKTPNMVGVFFAACFGFLAASNVTSAQLLEDNFSDGNYTDNPTWQVVTGGWSVVNGAVENTGLIANDFLMTRDFTAIDSGVFSISIDVKFLSEDVTGNNRLHLRMRDSTNGHAGYEVAIAQGTFANTTFNMLGGATARVSDQNPLISSWMPVSNAAFVVSFLSNSWCRGIFSSAETEIICKV